MDLLSSHAAAPQYLPSAVLLPVVLGCYLMGATSYLAFYITATYVSWLYLRFFQQQPESTAYGDASDDFKCVWDRAVV